MLYRSTHERGGANRGAATAAPFDLLRWFAILSALAVAVIAIGTALTIMSASPSCWPSSSC
jgi:hypothetical protein